jgi:hypothetical protein
MPERETVQQPVPPGVSSEERICPHLGLEEDRRTCLAYPSYWNFCHGCRPPAVARLSHQRQACLLPAHTACPVFQNGLSAPLPEELRGRRRRSAPSVPERSS